MDEVIESFEDYMLRMIDGGYIDGTGQPLKCNFCESTELEKRNEYYENGGTIEYQVYCKKCDKEVGHWAYGNWEI